MLEVGIPTFSVSALLGVTAWITYDALDVILHPENEKVNVFYLFGFASGNAAVDIVCAILFYLRRRDVLYNPLEAKIIDDQSVTSLLSEERKDPEKCIADDQEKNPSAVNLNMASALTHVSGDTLRTSAVFIAAVVAVTSKYSGALCDAWAAMIVTVTIIFIVIPLVTEIFDHAKKFF
jgi:Co/Zn/Cd efflux system component